MPLGHSGMDAPPARMNRNFCSILPIVGKSEQKNVWGNIPTLGENPQKTFGRFYRLSVNPTKKQKRMFWYLYRLSVKLSKEQTRMNRKKSDILPGW